MQRIQCFFAMVFFAYSGMVLAVETKQNIDLLQSYKLAVQQDSEYKAALASADAGRENANLAWAQLLPNVSTSYTRFYNDLETRSDSASGANNTTNSRYPSSNLTLTLRQPLYRPFNYTGYEQSLVQLDGIDAELSKSLQDLGLRVAFSYFNILLNEGALRYVNTQKALIVGQLKSAELAVKTKMGKRTDLEDAKAKLELNAAEEFSALQQIEESKHELGVLLNQKVDLISTLNYKTFNPSPLEIQSLEKWLTKAENSSPELKKLKSEMEVKRLEISRAESGHKPMVDLVMLHSDSDSDNILNPNARFINNQIGVQVTMPIYAGGSVDAQIRKAQADYKAATEYFESARKKLHIAVRKEFKSIEQSLQKISALRQAYNSAMQTLNSNFKGLETGTRTKVDILDSQERLGQAELNILREQLSYIIVRLKLQSLCNNLDEKEIQIINQWLSKNQGPEFEMGNTISTETH